MQTWHFYMQNVFSAEISGSLNRKFSDYLTFLISTVTTKSRIFFFWNFKKILESKFAEMFWILDQFSHQLRPGPLFYFYLIIFEILNWKFISKVATVAKVLLMLALKIYNDHLNLVVSFNFCNLIYYLTNHNRSN